MKMRVEGVRAAKIEFSAQAFELRKGNLRRDVSSRRAQLLQFRSNYLKFHRLLPIMVFEAS